MDSSAVQSKQLSSAQIHAAKTQGTPAFSKIMHDLIYESQPIIDAWTAQGLALFSQGVMIDRGRMRVTAEETKGVST